ncbi:ABC transporter permease [Streptomyces sp. NPDC048172]|uniref:ABC transporter permease n=1 Tax=Streptomyces sp. NPDC048172 TaxID=3365505 RepID=UPI00371AAE16
MFVAWRDLRFAKGRFALMGVVIVLITTLVGLLSGLTAGLGRENVSAITGLSADRMAFAAPADGQDRSFSDSTVTERQWRGWAEAPGVESAEPIGITTTRAESGDRSTAVSAFGVRADSGIGPESGALTRGRVVLSEAAAEELGADGPGARVTVAGQRLTVAAVRGDASFSHTPVVWTNLADWQRLGDVAGARGAPKGDHATVVALRTGGGGERIAATDARLGTDTVSRDDALSAIGSYTSENGSLQLMRGFLFAISALVIGAFFTVWTIQRSADVAVLKALGASTPYLLRDALGQAVVLLALGTAAGTGIAAGVGAAVSGTVPFVLDAATVLVPAAVLIVLGVAGAALAIRRITAVDPLTALGSAR